MKKTLLLIVCAAFATGAALAQKSVRESDLKGVWKLVIDIDRDEVREEIEDEDNLFAEILAKNITNIVFDVIDEIDIRFEFLPDNRLRIETEVFGASDVEYTDWFINDDGELVIGDTDNFRVNGDDGDDVWLREGDLLVAYEKNGHGRQKNKEVYLKPVN